MSTRDFVLGFGGCVLWTVPAFAQEQDFSAVQIETQQLADNLYMLIGERRQHRAVDRRRTAPCSSTRSSRR